MRNLILVTIMLISACASNASGKLAGNGGKADRTVVDKNLEADLNYIVPDVYQCRSNSVLVCSVGQEKPDCRCLMFNDANTREVQMLSRGERGAGRRRFRQ